MKTIRVKSIKPVGKNKVFDISVDKYENYILENGVVTHNSGLKYAASSIIYLSKRKEKDGTEVIGNIIHCKNYKSRLTKENAKIDVKLTYKSGLDRYYGLLDIAEEAGIFKKVSTRFEMPDGTKVFGKSINDDPEKYFTKEILDKIDEAAKRKFSYGSDESE